MLRVKSLPFLVLFTVLTLSSVRCTDLKDNRNLPIGRDGYALVLINLGYPEVESAANPAILDRLRGAFVADALAQSAPPAFISSATVRVVGADIGLIEQTFTGNPVTIISLEVPAGFLRTIEVTAHVATGDPSAAASFRGSTVANLPSGSTITLPLVMNLHQTKLIVPDLANQRLVQINDPSGAGWVERNGAYYGFATTFSPADVDFDNRGRIYFAKNFNSTESGVYRIDNMNTTTKQRIANDPVTPTLATSMLVIDRPRRLLYFATVSTFPQLYRVDQDGATTPVFLNTSSISFGSLGVDGDGFLYLTSGNTVYKYNPAAASFVGNTVLATTASDVVVKGQSVYVVSLSGFRIYHLDRNLAVLGSYGSQTTGFTTTPGRFYGPRKFIVPANPEIVVADSNGSTLAQLVSLADLSGGGWSQFGSFGAGVNQFQF